MAMFILDDATGIGSDDLDTLQAFIDLVIIANDDGVCMDDPVGGTQLVTYNRTENGAPQLRLDALVNTDFSPDYGSGAAQVDIIVIPALSGFTLDDGTGFADNGTALPPASSWLAGAGLNTTENCLVIYDTQQDICVARDGTGGDIDLPISNPVVLYHEFSHAFRIVNNTLLALGGGCDPSSPEENAAIVDENDLRTQIANRQGETPELRDPGIHCGEVGCDSGCCIIATVASKSLSSQEVRSLRAVRDDFVRSTEVGFAFFQRFFHDYYSFSPQVATIMAAEPGISQQVLDGFVTPLLEFWRIMIRRGQNPTDDDSIGGWFREAHVDLTSPEARLAALDEVEKHWLSQDATTSTTPSKLMSILAARAWPSEHIQWALIRPVRIYREILRAFLEGADDLTLSREFERELESWAPEVPISPVWGTMPRATVRREIGFCDQSLLQTHFNKQRFRERLRSAFPDVTALRCVFTGEVPEAGAI